MRRMLLLHLNSCRKVDKKSVGASKCGGRPWKGWAIMGLRLFFLISLLLLADAQKWPLSGDCKPCSCYHMMTSFGLFRTVNCSQRGIRIIPENLPSDLMALDLSWNSLDVKQLRRYLCQFKSLQFLSLSFTGLTSISDILKECTAVLELNLTGNRLVQLNSKTFQGLENLRRLIGLQVESIVSEDVFKKLTNLTDLDLIFHGKSLPRGLFDGLIIQSLNLFLIQSTSFPQGLFGTGQETLHTLQLVGENLTAVQEDMLDGLCALKKLFLVMPAVRILPESFFQHQSQQQNTSTLTCPSRLQEVEISGIQVLSANVFDQLVDLERLQLKEINKLPSRGFVGKMVNLQRLVITDCPLNSIPAAWFKDLQSLRTLKLSGIQLERLDEDAFEGLVNLENLDLSNNKLQHIMGKILKPLSQTLRTLIVSGNNLTEISEECMNGLRSLRFLDVSDNRLTNVFPESFAGLTNLSVLYFYKNTLTSLPDDLFQDQLQLKSLSVADNYLVEFPKSVLKLKNSLIRLDLSSNQIREVPASELCEFVNLSWISITDNSLHCDCRLMAFQQCPEVIVEGQCKTPEQHRNTYLSELKMPKSCDIKKQPQQTIPASQIKSKSTTSQPQTTPPGPRNQQPQAKQKTATDATRRNQNTEDENVSKDKEQQRPSNQTTTVANSNEAELKTNVKQNNTITRKLFPEELGPVVPGTNMSLEPNRDDNTTAFFQDGPFPMNKSLKAKDEIFNSSNVDIGNVYKSEESNMVSTDNKKSMQDEPVIINTTLTEKDEANVTNQVNSAPEQNTTLKSVSKLDNDMFSIIQTQTNNTFRANKSLSEEVTKLPEVSNKTTEGSEQPQLSGTISGKSSTETSTLNSMPKEQEPVNKGKVDTHKPGTEEKTGKIDTVSLNKNVSMEQTQLHNKDLSSSTPMPSNEVLQGTTNKPNQNPLYQNNETRNFVPYKSMNNSTETETAAFNNSNIDSHDIMMGDTSLQGSDDQPDPHVHSKDNNVKKLSNENKTESLSEGSEDRSKVETDAEQLDNSSSKPSSQTSSYDQVTQAQSQNDMQASQSFAKAGSTADSFANGGAGNKQVELNSNDSFEGKAALKPTTENVSAKDNRTAGGVTYSPSSPGQKAESEQAEPPSNDENNQRSNRQETNSWDIDTFGKTPEKIAFNFTISALAAVLFFGCSLLIVYGIHHWQQKGTYVINSSSEENEMDCMFTETKETACRQPTDDQNFFASGDTPSKGDAALRK